MWTKFRFSQLSLNADFYKQHQEVNEANEANEANNGNGVFGGIINGAANMNPNQDVELEEFSKF